MIDCIGIDPSLSGTGIARGSYRHCVSEDATSKRNPDRRLIRIFEHVFAAAQGCSLAAVEDLPTHGHGAGKTGMAQGAVRMALMRREVPYLLVSPATLKVFATGSGIASKSDMRVALLKRADIDEPNDNKVDAWWLRALALHWMALPLLDLPQTHTRALDKLEEPLR